MLHKINVQKIVLAAAMLLLLVSCGCRNRQSATNDSNPHVQGNISISGAFALYPITARWAEEFRKINPDLRIDISAGGAGKGMADALSGMVDLGMFSRGISPSEKEKGVWWLAVTRDAVLPTVNAKNPLIAQLLETGISPKVFQGIYFEQSIKSWDQCPGLQGLQKNINIFTRSDACGAAQMWAEFLGTNQESLAGIGVFGDPGMADAVKGDPLGMGYNNVVYVYDINTRLKYPGLEVIPIDINANGRIDQEEDFYESLDLVMGAIAENKYPSPPARDLYFVAAKKPNSPAVKAFLKWILTEGQQFVHEAGYVKLSDTVIARGINKLDDE
ncbi:MAG: PstS family phosphate ABC transporter substrate-binding protein [Bacteroidales bacterium]|nr:PstS family phosphate ABC transporter substrate-binding protein [Bacteroidales bacterium]